MTLTLLSGTIQSGESPKAIQACNDFCRMGPGRTLAALCLQYGQSRKNAVPTQSMNTLEAWSARYGWVDRAAAFDAAEIETAKNARRAAVLAHDLAQDWGRLERLYALADFLQSQVYEVGETGRYHNVWLPDVKQIGVGLNAARIDIERFNAAILSEYRAALEDIAAEVGGRAKRVDVQVLMQQEAERLAAVTGGSAEDILTEANKIAAEARAR